MILVFVVLVKKLKNVIGNKMSDKKPEITNDMLITDLMLRVSAIEKLLVEKLVFTQQELQNAVEEVANKVAKVVLDKLEKNPEKVIKN